MQVSIIRHLKRKVDVIELFYRLVNGTKSKKPKQEKCIPLHRSRHLQGNRLGSTSNPKHCKTAQ